MVRNVVALAFVAWFAREPGCGGAETPSSGLNAPCTRTKDCSSSLICAEGVCTEPDSGTPVLTPDGGTDGASGEDAAHEGG